MHPVSPPPGRFLTLHGHFYQPPRENPWLGEVEVEEGPAPYHDWNERITAECYAPNTAARRVDGDNRIITLVDNYRKISFNFGPTLLAWLERRRPETYARILVADRESRQERGGHGNAIAQAYNHVILPLATRRDKLTQARWGIADFRHRFGREPEGLWLPETATDAETLAVLVEAGLRFTVLAPAQCRRIRPLRGGPWTETPDEGVDPSRPYRYAGAGPRSLAVFFYDGAIARAIAFEGALGHGDVLAARLRAGFSPARPWPQLVHAATDGESYGHHHRFGDMALAAALERIEREGQATLTNYGAFLETSPPTHEAEIVEGSSWSCAHGVERWRADCGCRASHPDWHQRWRAPLREALDWLRDRLDPFFEARLGALLHDPWAARDEYVQVVLDRSSASKAALFARHQRGALDGVQQVEALRLLELQHQRLLMYTSCGWFFDDVSGLEAVQVLKYAARAIQLGQGLGLTGLEEGFVRRLAAAPSNVPELGDGAEVYRRRVRPAVVDVPRVVAHHAISDLLQPDTAEDRVFAFHVSRLDAAREGFGDTALVIGRLRVHSEITDETEEAAFAVLRAGEADFHCAVRGVLDSAQYALIKADLRTRYLQGGLSDVVHGIDQHFPGPAYALRDLFLDERRRVLGEVAERFIERCGADYQRVWEAGRRVVHALREAGVEVPEPLLAVARQALRQEATRLVDAAARTPAIPPGIPPAIPEEAWDLIAEARSLGVDLDPTGAAGAFKESLVTAMDDLVAEPTPERVHAVVTRLSAAGRLGLRVPRWHLQTRYFDLWRARPDCRDRLRTLAEPLGFRPEGPAAD